LEKEIGTLNSLFKVSTFSPDSLQSPDAWVGHLPFAAWIIGEVSPSIFVELGTHSGNSYFSFCQSVLDNSLSTKCYAVDTWQGDEHAGHYGEDIFTVVSAYHQAHYTGFSRLLRMSFDDAVTYFSDGSIELLHIDGLHTYNAVRHDFETWLPKLAPGAVVLLHDTNVRERDFGVWRLWEELRALYPNHLDFLHSHGLGVLQLNSAPKNKELAWLLPDSKVKQLLLEYFTALGSRQLERFELNTLRQWNADLQRAATERDGNIITLQQALAHRESQLTLIQRSFSWRITKPIRRVRQWVATPKHYGKRYFKGVLTWANRLYQGLPLTDQTKAGHRKFLAKYLPGFLSLAEAGGKQHYLSAEMNKGHDSSVLFNAQWYLDTYPDIRAAVVNPLKHFDKAGWNEGRNPHPLFDTRWYLDTYPDVRSAATNPLRHYVKAGWQEGRNPHPLFDTRWYLNTYPDVREAGINPLLHYINRGASELRHPHPDFDAGYYVKQHPEAADNPLSYHIQFGISQGWPTSPAMDITSYLPRSEIIGFSVVETVVDIIVPVYKGLADTRRCLESLMVDTDRPPGRILVIDDCSPEPELTAWLSTLAASGLIDLTRNEKTLGFVATVNRAMLAAGRHDVLLLNSDTEVPSGFLHRLAAHAYSGPKIASVTPFSNNGGEMCSYPDPKGGPAIRDFSITAIDNAFWAANAFRRVELPTGRGFCLFLRRDCLDEIGLFDLEAFGRGYGEETDFCLRALAAGWHHFLACDTYVQHTGEVSFGDDVPERKRSWDILVSRYPHLPSLLNRHLAMAPETPSIFAATVSLFNSSALPTILILNHNFNERLGQHIDDLLHRALSGTNQLLLSAKGIGWEIAVPSLTNHPTLFFPNTALKELTTFLHAFPISRVHIHHWIGLGREGHKIIEALGLPVDLTAHDEFSTCSRAAYLPAKVNGLRELSGISECDTCRPEFPLGSDNGLEAPVREYLIRSTAT
jgi:GT2 family glycosyltransferase